MRVSGRTRARLRRAKALSVGGELKDTDVSLVLYSPKLDVAKVTASLRCEPTYAISKGQIRHRPHGSGPAPIGHWDLEAPKPLGFGAKIQYILDATPKATSIWRRLAKGHDIQLRCVIFLRSWNEGFELPAQMVADIGARGWKIDCGLYSAEGNEIVEALLDEHGDDSVLG
jgi:hypothetical protein